LDAQVGLVLRKLQLADAVLKERGEPFSRRQPSPVELVEMPQKRGEGVLFALGEGAQPSLEASVGQRSEGGDELSLLHGRTTPRAGRKFPGLQLGPGPSP
jgi:hypothetical protein